VGSKVELTISDQGKTSKERPWAWDIQFHCGDETQGGKGRTGGTAENLTQALDHAGETVLTLHEALGALEEGDG